MTNKRYSILVIEYGSEKEVELCQVDREPESLVTALEQKTLLVYSHASTRRSAVRKYNSVRVVDNHAVR